MDLPAGRNRQSLDSRTSRLSVTLSPPLTTVRVLAYLLRAICSKGTTLHIRFQEHDMRINLPPALDSPAYRRHAQRLAASFHHWTGQHLAPHNTPAGRLAEVLFYADFAIVSHGTEDDPVFNFGIAIALRLFEMNWNDFIVLPSRYSAEPEASAERTSLMARVSRDGFVHGYQGVRVSATGDRFVIADATIWEVLDSEGHDHGRAARFDHWWPVPSLRDGPG